jgi:dGTPase
MPEKLTCYSVTEAKSQQRLHQVSEHPYRSAFERDRDRIMHSSAFRRLEGKTQVFSPGVNDHYRTRLTHSIEVAQIGRTIARVLGLNESLTEAICLGHDLGHSPFGHCGEMALNKLMEGFGGFEHNAQSLRIVDLLEHPYPGIKGLNLMYETRLGLAKHHSPYDKPGEGQFAEKNCSLEGQIADIADRIAYNCHDLEDGLKAGLISESQLGKIAIFSEAQKNIEAEKIARDSVRCVRTAKAIIDMLVSDCLETSKEAIAASGINSLEDVYECSQKLIGLSDSADCKLKELEGFLLNEMYLHADMLASTKMVEKWLRVLFDNFCADSKLMPEEFQQLMPDEGLERVVCDYIAGMTDRYCMSVLKEMEG